MPTPHDIRRATTVGQLTAAGPLFDSPARPEWAERFLSAAGHHMFVAYADGRPVGFITGIEMLHPDKGVEMCLYELAVAEPYRRRGIARSLIAALTALCEEMGCYDMWVGVDLDNAGALATYRATGAAGAGGCAVLVWDFERRSK
ncbi:GNAT family N-acetyltransferase [Streptomyces sp. LHD-70]|uniref:GNAT family N-acetyltransferase n=1 Tax=Streptomyces sp. LHD-70 TaxID=3072140 RepID=UPI00281040EA|nr:GNAT family N-acetyltransferase [Streptomyces sp. LHD-70]MDQ8707308.1 GNAT family N-acetyltransferase [Streptomyces sp. LHD-70]